MSDERLRELERALAIDPSDPERVDALIEERYRLGLPVSRELYDQRRFPPLTLALPPRTWVRAERGGEREPVRVYPQPGGVVEVPARVGLLVGLGQTPDPSAALAQLAGRAEVTGISADAASPADLAEVARQLPHLESVSLSLSGEPDLAPLGDLVRLTHLLGYREPPSTLGPLRALERLEHVHFYPWPRLDEESWDWLAQLPRLSGLSGWRFEVQGGPGIARLNRLRGLERLRLEGRALQDDDVAALLAGRHGLRELSLGLAFALSPRAFDGLERLPRLERLETFVALEDAHLRALPTSLRDLDFSLRSVSDAGLGALRDRPLERLGLSNGNSGLGEEALAELLRSCRELRELHLYRCRAGALLAALPPSLRELSLSHVPLGGLGWVERLPELRKLKLHQCGELPARELEHLRALPQLEALELTGDLAGDPFPSLRALTTLETLELSELSDVDLGRGALSSLQRLEHLILDDLATLGDTEGICELRALRVLTLWSTRMETLELIVILDALPGLCELDLYRMPEVDHELLAERYPRVRISQFT